MNLKEVRYWVKKASLNTYFIILFIYKDGEQISYWQGLKWEEG